jgi:ankyrin repeat protein
MGVICSKCAAVGGELHPFYANYGANRLCDNCRKEEFRSFRGLCKTSDVGGLKVWLATGVDLNASFNGSVLPAAVGFGANAAFVKLLLDSGANVEQQDQTGNTALLNSMCFKNNSDMVKLLVSYRADVNATNKEGESVLIRACTYKCSDTVRLLLDAGATVRVKTKDGRAPLSASYNSFSEDIAQLLLASGQYTPGMVREELYLHLSCHRQMFSDAYEWVLQQEKLHPTER